MSDIADETATIGPSPQRRAEIEQRLQAMVGEQLGAPTSARWAVDEARIDQWVEAMGMVAPEPAGRAPAAMLQAWTMRGYRKTVAGPPESSRELFALLAELGYTSVVATDSDIDVRRPLVVGDRITVTERLTEITPEKKTALGPGRFVTTSRTYTDEGGEVVGIQRWRLLRFAPPVRQERGPSSETAQRAPRPRPAVNRDNSFFFDAARRHELVIQRCSACGRLRHPPGPMCPHCHSLAFETIEASGQGTVFSYTVVHHPRHPAFDYPLVIAVVQLSEGTRLIADVVDVDPAQVHIGMSVSLGWLDADPDLTLPVFRRSDPTARS
ncbi:putative OB-fold protein [Branchiibius hedensis]|uniref:Uncharacterized OB-fold protein, contains Zn-ribbon domain n=1 Tax=Branchiibius hedensis TaxID=672460 RepID=A0A2Y9C2C8_9MICO|nr:bifunctional MaoC family dehydratase N-terminal/OB-fold nucleic acid binding domain-containing protein [Branchiibius hedensis]PWJ27062.1 putative OB-fold protein [Branchiibius hedensis]SSA35873.1 Uncharacterized OB-fold protein, contains Zn-ribbon domain [Branchiibius hedensis]